MDNIVPEVFEFVKEKIHEIINSPEIDEREEEIIRLRFGLNNEGPVNIKELSKMFNVSPRKMKDEVDNIERKLFNILKKDI